MYSLYALLLSMLCLITPLIEAAEPTRNYTWDVRYEFKSPDCFKKLAITINGMSPGPTITADQGDTIRVEVTNNLVTEGLTIHWHGIRQIGTPWSDGTEAVSQCPILPGETFVYEFVVDMAGTFLYHAHYGLQREAGLNGMIVVSPPKGEKEPFPYVSHDILFTDWYHSSTYERVTGLTSKPFVWVGEPQSLLIQGRGGYDCSYKSFDKNAPRSICNSIPKCSQYFNLTVEYKKTYRLRLGSLTSLSAISFQIENHKMKVVEADGHYVEPFDVDNLFIYSGETYSVLVTANQPKKNYWAKINVVGREPKTPMGLAIFNYNGIPLQPPLEEPSPGADWKDPEPRIAQSHKIMARQFHDLSPAPAPAPVPVPVPVPAPTYLPVPVETRDTVPRTADHTILLLNTQNEVDGYTRWALNNVSLTLPHTPYLVALKKLHKDKLSEIFDQEEPKKEYDWKNYDIKKKPDNVNASKSSGVYRLNYDDVVDVVLQNANMKTPGKSETHPWHLHGHDFWVLGYGSGKFNPLTDPAHFNLKNPAMKNTVPLHPYGWTAIRFRANNPGVWLFHCHIDSHFLLGMGVVFVEAIDKLDGSKLPTDIMGCGYSKKLISP